MSAEKYKERMKDAADNAARSAAAYRAKGRAREVIGSAKADARRPVAGEALEAEGHRRNADEEKQA